MDSIIKNYKRNVADLKSYNLPAEIVEAQMKYLNESEEILERVDELLWHIR